MQPHNRLGLNRAVAMLPREMVPVYQEEGAWVDGDWMAGGEILSATIKAVVHPLEDRERQRLELGEDDAAVIQIHTISKLQAATAENGQQAQTVDWHGDRWRVVKEGDFQRFGPNRYFAMKVAI